MRKEEKMPKMYLGWEDMHCVGEQSEQAWIEV